MTTKKYLIINADDYGYSSERDAGILDCYHDNSITSVSLMVNGCSAEEAVKKAQSVGLPMGLHLNMTEGSPVSQKSCTTIVGSDGFMLGKNGLRDAVTAGKVDLKEVEREIESQLEKFEQLTGRIPVSVDGHQHVHVIPGIYKIFASVMKKKGITLTRLPLEDNTFQSVGPIPNWSEFLAELQLNSLDAKTVFRDNGIRFPGFTGLHTMGADMTLEKIQNCISNAFDNQSKYSGTVHRTECVRNPSDLIVELMVHPGYRTGNCGGCGDGPDDFAQSSEREHEMKILKGPSMKEFYKEQSIKLISFKDLSEM